MTLQVVASQMVVILMTLEQSLTLLENIYSTSITDDDRNIFIGQATGYSKICSHKYQLLLKAANLKHQTIDILSITSHRHYSRSYFGTFYTCMSAP